MVKIPKHNKPNIDQAMILRRHLSVNPNTVNITGLFTSSFFHNNKQNTKSKEEDRRGQ